MTQRWSKDGMCLERRQRPHGDDVEMALQAAFVVPCSDTRDGLEEDAKSTKQREHDESAPEARRDTAIEKVRVLRDPVRVVDGCASGVAMGVSVASNGVLHRLLAVVACCGPIKVADCRLGLIFLDSLDDKENGKDQILKPVNVNNVLVRRMTFIEIPNMKRMTFTNISNLKAPKESDFGSLNRV
ncbi:hypothetical protein V8G54_017069 [Vigna mungo]|uniref:Uncharacterized protein n=1 Tax=Vigna mungo TaxID=3915 RepID=A0AAQ3NLE4_VIGMU